jgi:tetratricopeptide (TPR) repeat protein
MRSPVLIVALLLTVCVSLATVVDTRSGERVIKNGERSGWVSTALGDSRRLFASHFFSKADKYFHSGYYPSIFDGPKPAETHMEQAGAVDEGEEEGDEHEGHEHHENCNHPEHQKEGSFLAEPSDWIDRLGRNFYVTEHTHLAMGREKEMLPWLRVSAELDPQKVQTYVVASFWLRTQLGKTKEAEQFLREGLRANPDSYEILFEMGRIREENYQDPDGARNLWELALSKWHKQKNAGGEPNEFVLEQVLAFLGKLEEEERNFGKAISYFEQLKEISPFPEEIEKRIDEIKAAASAK